MQLFLGNKKVKFVKNMELRMSFITKITKIGNNNCLRLIKENRLMLSWTVLVQAMPSIPPNYLESMVDGYSMAHFQV